MNQNTFTIKRIAREYINDQLGGMDNEANDNGEIKILNYNDFLEEVYEHVINKAGQKEIRFEGTEKIKSEIKSYTDKILLECDYIKKGGN